MSANSPVVSNSRSKPRNVMRGLTPTVGHAGNAGDVANLGNASDENIGTFVDEATKTTSSSGSDVTTYVFDLGSNKVVDIGCLIQLKSTSGTLNVYIDQSSDGNTWLNGTIQAAAITTTNYLTKHITVNRTYYRYVRIRVTISGISAEQTAYSKLGEVVGSLVV